jgi:hypothetical protein
MKEMRQRDARMWNSMNLIAVQVDKNINLRIK